MCVTHIEAKVTVCTVTISLFYILFFVYYSLICPFSSHVMKELIATERIYVDELLSVLLVSFMAFCFC